MVWASMRGELVKLGGFPTAVSLFTFCYCGHSVFPTLCNSMKDRSQFPKVNKHNHSHTLTHSIFLFSLTFFI